MRPDLETPSNASEWMALLAEGPLTSADKAALTDWLRESPRNVREFLELKLLQEDLKTVPLDKQTVDAWVSDALSSAAVPLSFQSPLPAYGERARVKGLLPLSLAATLLILVAAAAGYYAWSAGRYVTGLGEQKIITLADGSVVTLNTLSVLKVDITENQRLLSLIKGEAFFRVAPDPARPFEVTAQGATVKALGTQFNVRIAPTATVVSVLDGAVEVRDREESKSPSVVRLDKGEEACIVSHRSATAERAVTVVEPERAAVTRSIAWTRGRVEFEDAPLADVLNEFRRYREFTVDIQEPLRELRLTGSFDAQDPESAFAYIETLPGVTVERPMPQTFIVREE